MLDADALEGLVRSRLDASEAERMLELVEPCLRLRTRDDSDRNGSRLGGSPLLADDIEWPEWRRRPLSFLAQFRIADLRASGRPVGGTGMLAVFYDAEAQESWGFDPADLGAWRVIQTADPNGARSRDAPSGAVAFTARGVDLVHEPTLPAPWEDAFLDVFNPGRKPLDELPQLTPLFELDDELMKLRGDPIHQAFGWPTLIQDSMQLEVQLASSGLYVGDGSGYEDPRAAELEQGAGEWRLLLQIDSDDELGWMWGDVGRLYFWIRAADLDEGRYERVWCILQCS